MTSLACLIWSHAQIDKLCRIKNYCNFPFHFVAGELFIFYSIFYIVLALLFAICMQGLMWTIDKEMPKYTLGDSRIGDNPGLGYRPISENLTQGSLIWFDSKNETQVTEYTKLIDKFLERKFDANSLFGSRSNRRLLLSFSLHESEDRATEQLHGL